MGAEQGARGPQAATYGVRADGEVAVAVDVTAHTATSTVVDATGAEHPVAEVSLARVAAGRDAVGDIRAAVTAACAASGADPAHVSEVVVGLQGAVDPRTDDLTFTGLLPGWPRRAPRARLEDGLGVRVRIDNDANLAAVAERAAGVGRGTDGFALLWLGEGLGVAVDLGGTLHRGASGGAGEIGYLPAPLAATELDATATDLQGLLGGPAVARMARGHGLRGRTLEAVLAALPSHRDRRVVLRDLAERIALGVVPVLAVLDPPLVVLGGPTGAAGGEELAELVRAQVRRVSRWSPQVAATAVPDHPVIRGARELAVADLRAQLLSRIS